MSLLRPGVIKQHKPKYNILYKKQQWLHVKTFGFTKHKAVCWQYEVNKMNESE